MTEELTFEWLREVWHRRPGALIQERGMLGLDAFRSHLTQKVNTVASNLLNTDLVIIPGGMTSQLQVLDVAVNKTLKYRLCACMGNDCYLGTVH
jgi:hypothetical protein